MESNLLTYYLLTYIYNHAYLNLTWFHYLLFDKILPIFYIYGLFSIVLLSLNVALNVYVCITLKNFPNSLYSNSKVIAVVPWQNIFAIFSAERNAGIFKMLTHFVLMSYKKIYLICKMYIQVV